MDSINYYNTNALAYIADTLNSDMSSARNRFLSYLPNCLRLCREAAEGDAGGVTILDAGCGSGRDAKAFKESGFDVYAIDASQAMVEHCRTLIGVRCELASFQEYHTEVKFDGIWACASLLHLKPAELEPVIIRFTRFLKPGGVFFMSFKYGEKDYIKDGRYFNCHTPDSIAKLLSTLDEIEILENFITSDVREGRSSEKWVNVIVKRKSVKLQSE